jgi:hypothetical protein
MRFMFPNPKVAGTGYDDGYFGPTAVAVALHELAQRGVGAELFLLANHHRSLDGDRVVASHQVRLGVIDGHRRFRHSDGGSESSLDGGPDSPVEISRAIAHLTAMMTREHLCIYRRA